jgi:hypothetical protein
MINLLDFIRDERIGLLVKNGDTDFLLAELKKEFPKACYISQILDECDAKFIDDFIMGNRLSLLIFDDNFNVPHADYIKRESCITFSWSLDTQSPVPFADLREFVSAARSMKKRDAKKRKVTR